MTGTEQDRWGELEMLARAATPGPWNDSGGSVDDFDADCAMRMEWMPNGSPEDGGEDEVNANWKADTAFIAAANPSAVLELIAEARGRSVGIANGDETKNNPMGAELLAALKEALANLDALDDYMKQPERGEWGVECAVCMNEWLEPHDRAAMERARALITRAEASTGEGE
jgi:hypothetical protein